MKTNSITINIESVVKETAKAILLLCPVTWGNGSTRMKEIWFPKSVVKSVEGRSADVADWFVHKTEQANTFNGYIMSFDSFNPANY